MNQGAGRGDELFVTIRLEDGEKLLFVLDTGCSGVLFDKSSESKLGACFWTHKIPEWYGMKTWRLFRAPKLYLGETELRTSGWVWTADLSLFSKVLSQSTGTNRPIAGILGMSCLKHYCLQLDFDSREVRFLDPAHLQSARLGRAFPLMSFHGCPLVGDNLVGVNGQRSLIDSGANFDGFLTPALMQRWTNHMERFTDGKANAVFGGNTYTNVYLGDGGINGIGLSFLARHLVTLDFPRRTMYLKQTSIGPLVDEQGQAAMMFLKHLKEEGRMPGWLKDDSGQVSPCAYPMSGIVLAQKTGDSHIYHYRVVQDAKGGGWKLERAWLTDANETVLTEFPVKTANNDPNN